jgi:diguanylate cyclase (GGDEF)-like protein/PAS domain S-box-containing protein
MEYRICDLLDITLIQALADSNFRAGGLPMTIMDAHDSSILVRAGWTDICRNFHRSNPLSALRCMESDDSVKGRLIEGESLRYKCKNGLWHVAIPVFVAGRHMATMLLSQFFFEGENPDRQYFIRQAEEFGYDVDSYMDALDRMPFFTVEKVYNIISFYKGLAHFISCLAELSLRVLDTQKTLGESEGKYRTLVDNVNIGIYRNTGGEYGYFIQSNPAMAKIFGYDSPEEFSKIPISSLYRDTEDKKKLMDELKLNGIIKKGEFPMRKKDGSPIWCSITATAHFDDNRNIKWFDGVMEDITDSKLAEDNLKEAYDKLEIRVEERTADLAQANEQLTAEIAERKKAEEMLRELSEKDYLTMILNRRKLFELLGMEVEKAKRYNRPLSLILFDLDHFKAVNDKYGHNMGDIVLKTTAAVVGKELRKIDILARYGGEEFVILSPETGLSGALAIAEKVRSSVEQHPYKLADPVTISVGVAEMSEDDTETSFIEKADKAMYSAKRNGRNRVEGDHRSSEEKPVNRKGYIIADEEFLNHRNNARPSL